MATPNYQFEKRRRELEKKAKKEEKRRHKLEAAQHPVTDDGANTPDPITENASGDEVPTA